MVPVAPGTIVVFSDIGCPWAHLCVYRLLKTRGRLGLDDDIVLDHHVFPLELINRRPTPKKTLDAEIVVAGGLEPDAGWRLWPRRDWEWPVTMLPALQAVQAAKGQGLRAAEQLDRALRLAFFDAGETVSMRHVVLDVAGNCDLVDVETLVEAMDEGGEMGRILADQAVSEQAGVQGSPHLFLPDGTGVHNPGVTMHWHREGGFPVVDKDDPSVYEDLLERAPGQG